MSDAGTLYLVATPIGNLQDITLRAIEVLRSVDRIACEDTRRTRKLLAHLGISRPLISVPSHDEKRRAPRVVACLTEGEDVAFVSDAGMPAVSDPGALLVAEAVGAGVRVVPVPGPSAVVSAVAVSGVTAGRFAFLGFPPRKAGERRRLLDTFGELPAALVLQEAPARFGRLLAELSERLGGERKAVVCRELTKMHEEIVRGTLKELADRFVEGTRGEVTLVIEQPAAGDRESRQMLSLEEALEAVKERVSRGERLKEACKVVARDSERLDARQLYKAALKARD